MGLLELFKKKAENEKEPSPTAMAYTEETASWRSKHYLSIYDCGSMQEYTNLPDFPYEADEQGVFEGLRWKRYGNHILILGGEDSLDAVIRIPSEINGYTVTGIHALAFINRTVSEIYVPSTVTYVGAMAVGFTSSVVYSDAEEDRIKKQNPFAHNHPTSTLEDFTYYLHQSPKTTVHGTKNSIAEAYAQRHQLPFVSE